jgi:ribosomal protein uL24
MDMDSKTKKPQKQRWRLHNVPLHQRSKLFTVRLDDALRQEWGIKRISLRKDDEVRVIKGEMVNVEGKVLKLKRTTGKIEIEECTFEKKNGSTYYIPISPANVVVTKLGGKKLDKTREALINRKQKLSTSAEPVVAPKKVGGNK